MHHTKLSSNILAFLLVAGTVFLYACSEAPTSATMDDDLAAGKALQSHPAVSQTAGTGTGTLFGTSRNSFLTVSPFTGVGIFVGFMVGGNSGVFPSLAVDPITGIMYAGGGAGAPFLHTVIPGTGAVTFVGTSGLGFAAIGGMDFRADGTLFAAVNIAGDGGTGSDHLATINPNTGAATIIGPFGTCVGVVVPSNGGGFCTIEGIEGISFDSNGVLWGSLSARGGAGAPGLYTISTATGAATFVSPILDGAGNPPSGGVVSLKFACDGTLFGGTARALGPADGGFLVTINPNSGLFGFVGGISATPSGQSLGGLAFDQTCVIEVDIDIKPGSDPNSINCNNDKEVVTVAILTTDDFDATTVDHTTVTFEGASETHVDKKTDLPRRHEEDVDGDGDTDLVFHFRLGETSLDCGSTEGGLSGETFGGDAIGGVDTVRMVGG